MTRQLLYLRLRSIENALYRAVMSVCVTLLGIIVLTITAAITARFIFFTPLNFADPLSKYLMQWMAFLGIGLAIKRGEHVLVELAARRLFGRARLMLSLAVSLSVIVLFFLVFWYGLVNAWSARSSSDPFVFGVPLIYPYLSVPVGAFYALTQAILSIGITLTGPGEEQSAAYAP